MPVVSVIIPTYNCAKFITEAIESVLSQSYRDFEIIVVDDGSTDNTAEIIRPYLDKVSYVCQKNGRPSKARNAGIKIARGKYIAFLDADDFWEPEKIAKQINLFKKDPDIRLVFSDVLFLDQKSMTSYERRYDENFRLQKIILSSVLIERESLKEAGYFDETLTYAEDIDLFFKVALKYKIDFVPEVSVTYRVHGNNITKDDNKIEIHKKDRLTVLERIYRDKIAANKFKGMRRDLYHVTYQGVGTVYFSKLDFVHARRNLIKGLSYKPWHLDSYILILKTFLGVRLFNYLRELKKTNRD